MDHDDDFSLCSERTAPPEEFEEVEVQPLQKGKPVRYCVDWRNVLQHYNEDFLRPEEKAALKQLLKKSEVVVISAVGKKRLAVTQRHLEKCLAPLRATFPNLKGWHCVLEKTGQKGKVALALEKGCHAIIDDNGPIIKEAVLNNMTAYPIVTRHHGHDGFGGVKHSNFPAAVEYIMQPGLMHEDS